MSSATFDSTAPNAGLISNADATEDSLLAYTYPADENREDVHYLAIPVDALNTRSVTIQVFYDQGRGSPTIMKLTSEKNTRTVVLNGNMKLFKANSAEKKQSVSVSFGRVGTNFVLEIRSVYYAIKRR